MTDRPPPPLPARDPAGHKGTFGTATIVGGCHRGGQTMLGAPVLAARAALRAGAGLARLVLPSELVVPALGMLPSATAEAFDGPAPPSPPDGDALVVGPGLGPDDAEGSIAGFVRRLTGPRVIDADGLNALAASGGPLADRHAVLTPHPGEAGRLAAAYKLAVDLRSDRGRTEAADALAGVTGSVVVLKGRGTVVSDGGRRWVCQRGHPCLGTGGTGDVLAGLIGGLLAQSAAGGWTLDAFDLARIAVEAHAVAGETWADRTAEAGLLAHELADELPGALRGRRQ